MSNAANNREVEDVLRTIVKEIVLAANYARSRIKYKTSTPPTGAADGAKPTTADTKAPAQVQAPAPPYRITETLAAFIVRAIVMNPANGFDISAPLPKPEIERLIKVSGAHRCDQNIWHHHKLTPNAHRADLRGAYHSHG